MSGWTFLEYDRFTGLRKALLSDQGDGKIRVRYVEDVEPILERNKALQNNPGRYERQKKAGLVHVGSIPPTVQIEWMRRYGVNIYDKNATKKVMALLNSPEWSYLKTTRKKV